MNAGQIISSYIKYASLSLNRFAQLSNIDQNTLYDIINLNKPIDQNLAQKLGTQLFTKEFWIKFK